MSECKKWDNWNSCKDDSMWNSSTCSCRSNKTCKIDEHLDIKTCWYKKRNSMLIIACEDEILNTTETSADDNKITREKNENNLINTLPQFDW